MILILEGVDCSGKSTLAEELSKKTGFEVVKGSSFEISELGSKGMYKYMMDLLDRDGIIIDRFLYSNLVYGELFDYPMMTPFQYDTLVEKMDKSSMLIYLYSSTGVIQYRMEKRGDDMIRLENVPEILKGYSEALYGDYRPSRMLSIDTTATEAEEEADVIHGLYQALHKTK